MSRGIRWRYPSSPWRIGIVSMVYAGTGFLGGAIAGTLLGGFFPVAVVGSVVGALFGASMEWETPSRAGARERDVVDDEQASHDGELAAKMMERRNSQSVRTRRMRDDRHQ